MWPMVIVVVFAVFLTVFVAAFAIVDIYALFPLLLLLTSESWLIE